VAYNALDLTTSVQDDLKDPAFSTSRILRYLNYGQLAIFNTHSFRFCETSVSGALTIGEYTYESNTGTRFIFDSDNYIAHREFFERYPDPALETEGLPGYWTEFGDQIYFSRAVDKAYTFTQRYFRFPTSMADDADVPDVPEAFRELLEFYALYRAEKYRGNHDVAATYKQDFEDGLEAMALRFSEVTAMSPTVMRGVRTRVDA